MDASTVAMPEALPYIIPSLIGFALFLWFGLHGLGHFLNRGKTPEDPQRRRASELLAWALSNGYDFDRSRDEEVMAGRSAFQVLRPDDALYGLNTICGKIGGASFECFEHHFEIQTRDSDGDLQTSITSRTMAAFEAPFALPSVRASHSSSDSGDDIDFESAAFNENYKVHADDRRAAFDLIHPRSMELLMDNHRLEFECHGTTIMFTKRRREAQIREIEKLLAAGSSFLELVPPHLATR